MKITEFRIENFRNLKLAECTSPPDFMVICGGNGCGKSAVLNAIMTAKERAGAYGNFEFDPRAVSADAEQATIRLSLQYSAMEQEFVKHQFKMDCPAADDIEVVIKKGGSGQVAKRSPYLHHLLSYYSKSHYLGSPGFFDYIDAYRPVPQTTLSTWDASYLSDLRAKETLGAKGSQKFQNTKAYLAGLVMRDLQQQQESHLAGEVKYSDSLKPIREFFNGFFSPMKFVGVQIHKSPFEFIIDTPRGVIDLDDLSSGEKEVLSTFIRFHQLNPKGAVILFDEADAHLHPDLERRYLQLLKAIGEGNQLWLTTHSPEMMMEAGSESLYTVLKQPPAGGGNQFVKVSSTQERHTALSEVMGSRGLVSFNQRIVFIEGEETSADREVYEKLYPPSVHHVSFVPAGNSATVRRTAERVNELLSESVGFQQYFSIVDGDIDRAVPAPGSVGRLFQLSVYHVENFLLANGPLFQALKEMLASKCPYSSEAEVEAEIRQLVLADQHVKPLAKAMQDARIAKAAKEAGDAVFKGQSPTVSFTTFAQTESDAVSEMQAALADGSWRAKCKGREVLKTLCGKNELKYEHFRNVVIAKLGAPPKEIADIMAKILA